MSKKTPQPMLIRRQDVPDVYGLEATQLKHWVEDGRLSHVHPSGLRHVCYLIRAELDDLIAQTTTRAKRR